MPANGAFIFDNLSVGSEQHIVFLGSDGSLVQSWYDGSTWNSQVLPGRPATWPIAMPWYFRAPGVGGVEIPVYEQHIFFRDVNGALAHTWASGMPQEGPPGWKTELVPGTPADTVGGPLICAEFCSSNVTAPKTIHVFYVQIEQVRNGCLSPVTGTQARLHHSWIDDSGVWKTERVQNSPMVDAPFAPTVLNYAGGPTDTHVLYVVNGQLAQTWWEGTQWITQAAPGAPLPGSPAGQPMALGGIFADTGESLSPLQHVFFVAADGSLQQSWWDGNQWQNQVLPGFPLGKGLQVSYFKGSQGLSSVVEQHVFFIGRGGGLEQSWFDGRTWQNQPLAGHPSRLLGVCSVDTEYSTNGGTDVVSTELHVFFRADDGSLQQTWWDGNNWNNQTLPAQVAPMGGFGP